LPFIQDVTYYEKRVLSLIPQDAQEVILSDQKRLMVDAYARYQISDPLLFYQTVRNELGARGRLEAIIDSSGSSGSWKRNFGVNSNRAAQRHHTVHR
jgi:membrane protease subunit HflC